MVNDLPAVVPAAAEQLAERGLGARATIVAGDYLTAPETMPLISVIARPAT